MSREFVHLHSHTQYSLLDGAIRLPDMMKRAKELNMPAVAITDHGNMFGAVNFYQAALKEGIQPVIGCEVYVAPGDRRDKENRPGEENAYHLVLLAQNEEGYRNLVRMVSQGYMEGFYYKPRIDMDLLEKNSKGLIALSACLQGMVPKALVKGMDDKAEEAARRMLSIMGEGNFFIELQDHGIPEQRAINPGLIDIADRLGIGMVATNDCHFLTREDHQAHDLLMCIQTGKTVLEPGRMKMSPETYFKSGDEMHMLFGRDDLIANTLDIAKRCEFEMPLGKLRFPKYELEGKETAEERLEKVAREGLEERIAEQTALGHTIDRDVYNERLEYELDVLFQMGFAGYFLVVSDFIVWSKDHGIPVGPGRGSAAGSLVAYSMRITDLDPIYYDLIFERFLNLERKSMPDIDVDFCPNRRHEVIQYVADKYGQDHVGQIITFGSMLAKAVIRDVGRAMDMPFGDVDKIAKLIPSKLGTSLQDALDEEPKLRELMKQDPQVKELIDTSLRLEGLHRHASTHAAGVVIGDEPLREIVPLFRGANGETVSQYDMKCVEKAGLIKFDFLGLRNLTVIDIAVQMIRANHDPEFDIAKIDLADQASYDLLCKGDTTGVFQLESAGMKELLTKLRPSVFEDVIALVALYRPGPLGSGMVDTFVNRKHGREETKYLLPELEPILKETYGTILYQEQVQAIARKLAGYSLGEGDILRRAMGKKIPEVMAEQKDRFMRGAEELEVDLKIADEIFEQMAEFAKYGFNKSHSAAYGLIAFQTAFLKAHYPLEFMASLLTSEMGDTDKVMKDISECREHDLEVLPPDINRSGRDFVAKDNAIIFGMAAVKNVGDGAVESILAAREKEGPYKDLYDFCERVDLTKVNRRVMESLIKCGAFDSTGAHRAQLMAGLDKALENGQAISKSRMSTQESMFATFSAAPANNGVEMATLPNVPEWEDRDKLTYEKEALGFYITGHPLNEFAAEIKRMSNWDTSEVANLSDGATVRLAALTTEVSEKIIQKGKYKGQRMAIVRLEDLAGNIEGVVFSEEYALAAEHLKSERPVLVDATVKAEDKGNKLMVKKVRSLEEAAQSMCHAVQITLNATGLDREKLVMLKQTLSRHPGKCRVNLHLAVPESGVAKMILPNMYRVDPQELLMEEVNGLFGHQVVRQVLVGD